VVKAVFLDRDGVINEALVRDGMPYPPLAPADFILQAGVPEACVLLKKLGFLLIVATNQPDVGRGMLARTVVDEIHASMVRDLPIDRVEVCFHPGGNFQCSCRKPLPGMLLAAAAELNIDLPASWMIGDRWRDVDCGKAAGCRTVFVDNSYAEELRELPDFRVKSLLEAALLIERTENAQ